jgi:hypothetical protein
VASDTLTFCSRYMEDMDIRFKSEDDSGRLVERCHCLMTSLFFSMVLLLLEGVGSSTLMMMSWIS